MKLGTEWTPTIKHSLDKDLVDRAGMHAAVSLRRYI